ncbi:anti-sigma factor [Actinomadura sp. BRA 177]|uniref:anti-sigma factor domain-containing protein n=1 Tax=Actinomadura sp. BRA 177 TaxID=2745202 RepID=UPI0034D97249
MRGSRRCGRLAPKPHWTIWKARHDRCRDRRRAAHRAPLVASASRGRVVVASSGLRTLPSSKAYQLWLIDADGPRSAGLLPDDRTHPVVAGTWRPSDKLGVTVEPAGGSARPTTTPLVLVSPA